MSFEFFFGLFGLISSDSKWSHKSRLDNDWRLSTPLGASLFRAMGQKSASLKSSADSQQQPIFSTAGTLANNSGERRRFEERAGRASQPRATNLPN